MISLFTGKIGSGKTLRAVGEIVKHLAKGGFVYTNIELIFLEVQRLCRVRHRVVIQPEQLRSLAIEDVSRWHESIEWGVPGHPVLIVLDEIHLFFNSRDWAKTQALHKDMLSFLSQSRKACVDVVFICQAASTLEKQFRVQSEWEFYCRNVKDIRVPFLGTVPMNMMLCVKKDVENDKAVDRTFSSYDKALFPLYDTRAFLDQQMREAAEGAQRLAPLKLERVPLIPRRVVWSFFVALLLVLGWLFIPR